MKAVLIATDLIKEVNGDLKVLETNTNAFLSNIWSLYDFSALTSFIQSNNFTTIKVIVSNTSKPFSLKMKEICDSIGVTHMEYVVSNESITIPDVEDDDSSLTIRVAYDTTAIIDDEYCKDKFALQKLVHDQSFGAKTYIPVEMNGVVIDDFANESEFNYTDNVPNFIVKCRYPNYDREVYPKLFKIQNLTELNNLKSSVTGDYYLQEFVQSGLVNGRRNIVRSIDLLYGSNLDVLNIGGYISTHQIEESIWENTFDETGLLAKKDRPKYITHTLTHRNSEAEYIYDVDQDIAMADGSRKTFSSLVLGDSVKTLHIEGLDINETTYDLDTWSTSYSDFVQNLSVTNTSVVVTRESEPVSKLFIRLTLNDGTEWDDTKQSPLLVKDGDVIKFKRVNYMEIGDTIIIYNFETSEIELKTVENIEIVFKENMVLGSLDVEPIDLYLPFVGGDIAVIQHNLCRPFCLTNACANYNNCSNCTTFQCLK